MDLARLRAAAAAVAKRISRNAEPAASTPTIESIVAEASRMKLQLSQVIDRPPAEVFRFIATNHVQNHPRWDPQMQLEQLTQGSLVVGTVIVRRNTHSGAIVGGTMEVVEFEPDHAFGLIINDGPIEMHSRMIFEPEGPHATRVTATLDVPSMADPMDPGPIEQSMRGMKELIESEP